MEKEKLTSEQYRRKMRTWRETRLPPLQRQMAKRLLDKIGEVHKEILGELVPIPPERMLVDLDYKTKVAIIDWKREESKIAPAIYSPVFWVRHRWLGNGKVEFSISEEFELLCEGNMRDVDIFTQDHPCRKYVIS